MKYICAILLLSSIAYASDRTDLAAQMAYAVVTTQPPVPTPIGDKCSECGGSGKLGDGVVSTTCPHCKGTGVEPKPMPAQAKPAPLVVSVPRMTSSRWSIGSQSYKSASTAAISSHLQSQHGIDTAGMSRESMLNAHDNAHAGVSCPTGKCPR